MGHAEINEKKTEVRGTSGGPFSLLNRKWGRILNFAKERTGNNSKKERKVLGNDIREKKRKVRGNTPWRLKEENRKERRRKKRSSWPCAYFSLSRRRRKRQRKKLSSLLHNRKTF